MTALPPGPTTAEDLMRAADAAMLAGDTHAARRHLAEAIAKSAEERDVRREREGGRR